VVGTSWGIAKFERRVVLMPLLQVILRLLPYVLFIDILFLLFKWHCLDSYRRPLLKQDVLLHDTQAFEDFRDGLDHLRRAANIEQRVLLLLMSAMLLVILIGVSRFLVVMNELHRRLEFRQIERLLIDSPSSNDIRCGW